MSMWFSCTETYQWSAHTSSSFVIYWCWHIFVLKMSYNFNIVFDYLLMLTIFHVQNVPFILDWCLCDFLVLKHIDEVYALHLHLSFTDVNIFLCCKCSRICIVFLIIYWCWLFLICKLFSSFSTDVYVISLYWNISMECTHFIFICHLLMLTYFCVENVLQFQYCFWLFTDVDYFSYNFNIVFDYLLMLTIFHVQNVPFILDWCLCDFLVLKHIDEVYALHLHLSFTDVNIFLCCKCSRICIVFLIIYWCWLFLICKLFSSFSTDVYVISLYWNILMKCTPSSSFVIYWCWHIFVL